MAMLRYNPVVPAWFDPAVQRRLDRYQLALRRGHLAGGAMRGARLGGQLEFVEHRPYAVGDDLKHLDWNAFGRLNQLHVKAYAEEAASQVDILVDGSASMAVPLAGAGRRSRRGRDAKDAHRAPRTPYEAALLAATCVAYLALRGGGSGRDGGHRVHVSISDAGGATDGAWRRLPSRRGPAGFLSLLRDLADEPKTPAPTSAALRFAVALTAAADRLPRAGLAVIVTDGYDADALQAAVARLAQPTARRVALVHIAADPEPLGDGAGDVEGALRLLDAETGAAVTVDDVDAVRAAYRQAYADFVGQWRNFCSRHGVFYVQTPVGLRLPEVLLAGLYRTGVAR